MALWLTRSGRHCEHESKFLQESRIFLTWDGLVRDLTVLPERKDLMKVLEEIYPSKTPAHRAQNSGQIWAFVKRMAPGDWVCMPSKRKTIHLAEIAGDYQFDPKAEELYCHWRAVKWLETDIPRSSFDQDILNSLGAFTTICQIKRNDAEARVRAMEQNGWKSTGTKPAIPTDDADADDSEDTEARLDLEQIGRDEIARLIYSKYAGHGLEEI